MVLANFQPNVAIAQVRPPRYQEDGGESENLSVTVARTSELLGWGELGRGPFGKAIHAGSKVVIKPNLVLHENQGPWGIEPLVTHPSLIRVVTRFALEANPSEIVIGDAPLQGCDLDSLLMATGLTEWSSSLTRVDGRYKGIRDFRRTTCVFRNGVRIPVEDRISKEQFVLFDLGKESLLEPITSRHGLFRVTCYDPRPLAETHAPGRHRYLVARDILDADVVINLPKLKTHKKAGITCALKNLIGINGNKEYLPHHRVGGSESGGDCYPGRNHVKRAHEYVLDRQNMATSYPASRFWRSLAVQLNRAAVLMGDQMGIEGSWAGNDTVWRTCLDLNRILLYGRHDGTMAETVQRRVIHIVDSIVAGQGDGPLSPIPLPLGILIAGDNPAAVDYCGALLLGYDPSGIPLTRNAFETFRWPIAHFAEKEIVVQGDLGSGVPRDILKSFSLPGSVIHPIGWRLAE